MPPGRPRQQSLQQRRAALLDAATACLADDATTSLEVIATRAGCSKPSLYELFESRDALLAAIVDTELAEFRSVLDAARAESEHLDVYERVRFRVGALVAHVRSRPAGARLLIGLLASPTAEASERFRAERAEVRQLVAARLGPLAAELTLGGLRAVLFTLPDQPPEHDATTVEGIASFITGGVAALAAHEAARSQTDAVTVRLPAERAR